MTYAPQDLLDVRAWIISRTGLAGNAVGIVGDPDHAATGGYHEGNDDLDRVGRVNIDYSKRESPRDRPGSNAASALDIGAFDVVVSGRRTTLRSLSAAIVDACVRGDPRTADIREVIWSPDGVTVQRWDRLGIRSTGDSSHTSHTHLSFFRDSEGRRSLDSGFAGLIKEIIEGGTVMLDETMTVNGQGPFTVRQVLEWIDVAAWAAKAAAEQAPAAVLAQPVGKEASDSDPRTSVPLADAVGGILEASWLGADGIAALATVVQGLVEQLATVAAAVVDLQTRPTVALTDAQIATVGAAAGAAAGSQTGMILDRVEHLLATLSATGVVLAGADMPNITPPAGL